jgi:hypothetical protein
MKWEAIIALTALAASMAVNTLVTGLIVFRILKVERTLGSSGGSKFHHIIFVIIESGMALFAIQLIRTVLSTMSPSFNAFFMLVGIHAMFNVIIRSVHFHFILLMALTWKGHHTNNNFGSGLNETVIWCQRILIRGNCRKSSI